MCSVEGVWARFLDHMERTNTHVYFMLTITQMLLKLPASLGFTVLSAWLDLEALSKLDVAICNRQERKLYVELLAENLNLTANVCFKLGKLTNQLQWLIRRSIKSSSITCRGKPRCVFTFNVSVVDALGAYVRSTAPHLHTFSISVHNDNEGIGAWLDALAHSQCSLRALKVSTEVFPEMGKSPVWSDAFGQILINSALTLEEISVTVRAMDWAALLPAAVKLPALRRIEVPCVYDFDVISVCSAAPNVTEIALRNSCCTIEGYTAIANTCHNLQKFTVESDYETRDMDDGISIVVKACRKLTLLSLRTARRNDLTDAGLLAVATYCSTLHALAIEFNDSITDASVAAIARNVGQQLQYLSLRGCRSLTGTCLPVIAQYCPLKHTLRLDSTHPRIMSQLLLAIPHMHSMQILHLFDLPANDVMLQLVAEHMPLLQELDITSTYVPAYTGAGLVHVMQSCVQLRLLVIGVTVLTSSEIEQWQLLRPRLKVAYTRLKVVM